VNSMSESLTPAAKLADLAERFWTFQCHEFPVLGIQAGVAARDAVLMRESPADHARRYTLTAGFLFELDGISTDRLTAQDRMTHRLLRREFDELRVFYELRAHQRPSLFPMGPEFLTIQFANTASISRLDEARLYADRLATIPAFLSDLIENLAEGHAAGFRYPKRVLECAARAVHASLTGPEDTLPWNGPFKRTTLTGSAVDKAASRARLIVSEHIEPAFAAYAEFLEGPLSVGAHDSVSCMDSLDGEAFYRAWIRHYTTTDLTPQQIHDLGLAEVRRLTTEMEAIAEEAGYRGDLAGYRRHLASDPSCIAPSREALREQIEILSKRIDLKIPAFFGRIPRSTYGVQSIPEAMSALAPPAYAQPNPADGSGPGVHWVTSLPHKAPSFMHVPLALHEAWPGHLMHLALIQEMDDLPAFRRYGALRYSACLEGWALYCERLGVEMGLYQTPHQHYGRLDMEIWRALRLAVDTGLHSQGWTRERAIEFMSAHQAMPRPTIESEVDRYISMPAQALAYQIGGLEFRRLRALAERQLGERFDIRSFHDALMAAGPVTLPVLADVVDEHIRRALERCRA
jgi:uncharacterized protein (DUF885 family)